jgi:hypothetical protein
MSVPHINDLLDNLIRPHMHLLGRKWSMYQICGYSGLTLAVILAMALVMLQDLSPVVMAAITLSAVITFLALAFATKLLTGQELLIYYHHEIAVLMISALLLYLLGQPVWDYLDITILGIGTFLVCGRLGCLMVGCCHGRPHRWGVCYSKTHAAQGFTTYYVAVRLFPIQALEMLWVLGIVLVGIYQVLTGQAPGTALAWYVIVYDIGRFGFEFMRGDPSRPYWLGFSEAQWISVGLMAAVAVLELAGIIPLTAWHVAATMVLMLIMLGLSLFRHFGSDATYRIVNVRHIKQIAEVLALSKKTPASSGAYQWPQFDKINVGRTLLGIQISTDRLPTATHPICQYTLSNRNGTLSARNADELARVILQLNHPGAPHQMVQSHPGIFHLLISSMSK